MATRKATFLRIADDAYRVTWTGLLNGDDGDPVSENYAKYADRSVQALGTFGAGGNLRVEGSNDGATTYATLNDPSSTALDITAAKVKQVLELTGIIRPHVTAGDGTTSLTCVMFMRKRKK